MKRGDFVKRVSFLVLFLVVAIASVVIVSPLLTALAGGALLAYITHPVYKWLNKKVKSDSLSALIVSVLVIFIITIPTVVITTHLAAQAQNLYIEVNEYLNEEDELICDPANFVCRSVQAVQNLLENEEAKEKILSFANKGTSYLTDKATALVLNLPHLLLMVFVAIFTMFYLIRDGGKIFRRIINAIPLQKKHNQKIIKQFSEVTNAIIFGSIVIAIVQGVVAAIGFWIFGIESFLMWGVITTFAALVPFVGPWLVWFPASLYLIGTGYLSGESGLIIRGILLAVYGVLIISTLDNILKPILVAGKAKVHPLLILLGVVGGLLTMGVMGLLIGPVLLGLLATLFSIYEKDIRG
jgi:predicted PurR-regulated permease PerM